LRYL
jgi:hypothetical protein